MRICYRNNDVIKEISQKINLAKLWSTDETRERLKLEESIWE